MSSISIKIDISSLGLEQDDETGEFYPGNTLEQNIIDGITRQLLGDYGANSLRRRTEEILDEQVSRVVREQVSGFLAGPIQKRDRYDGKPIGEPTSIKELAMTAVEKYLTAPSGDRSYGSAKVGNLGELVDETVKGLLQKELKPTIDAAKQQIHTTVVRAAVEATIATLTPKP